MTHVRAQSIITTIAGNGITEFSGDGGPADTAEMAAPSGICMDRLGNLYIADNDNHRVRIIDPSGIINTFAGDSAIGYTGDGHPADSAELHNPQGVCLDQAGNLYITDWYNDVVRKVNATTHIITTVCGNGSGGFGGDNGPATSAHMEKPSTTWVDAIGNIYIADYGNNRVRKVDIATGTIHTIAGNGTSGFSGNGGLADTSRLSYPNGVCTDTAGNVYISDNGNNMIRKIDAITGLISTVAGTGQLGYAGDNGPAADAKLASPNAVFVDSKGILYISDNGNNVVRAIIPNGTIYTIAGNGSPGYTGDNGPATQARLNSPTAVFVDTAGYIYIADGNNSVIRKVTPPVLGVNNVPLLTGVDIFPNPSNGKFTLRLKQVPQNAHVEVANAIGQKIHDAPLNSAQTDIDISPAPPGVYFISILSPSNRQTQKIQVYR